jgi:acyl-CoA reductase-like NAD-dependent aldehyde dehydrogenase
VVHEAFWNTGQWCAAKSRLIVEAEIYDDLLDAVAKAAAQLVPGDPLDPSTRFGTIATRQQFDRIAGYVDRAHEAGAVAVGPALPPGPCALSMAPVIFGDVAPGMEIAKHEIFGPVLCASRFAAFDEALALANATPYGLAATVWTRDIVRAEAAMRVIQAGKITVRASAADAEWNLSLAGEPWGASGFGVEGGIAGMQAFARLKAIEVIR